MSLGSYAQLTEEWGLTFPGDGQGYDDYVRAIDFDENDNIISTHLESPYNFQILRKHDPNGNLLWEKELPMYMASYPLLAVCPNQNILLLAGYNDDMNIALTDGAIFSYSGDFYFALFIMNDSGDMMDIKVIDFDQGQGTIYELMMNDDNEIFITLKLDVNAGSPTSTVNFDSGNTISTDIDKTYIVKLDATGNYINHTDFTGDYNGASFIFDDILYTWKNNYPEGFSFYKHDMDLNQLMNLNTTGYSFLLSDIFVNEFGVFVSGRNRYDGEEEPTDFDFGNSEYILDTNINYSTAVMAGYSHDGELKFVNSLNCLSYGFTQITGRDSFIYGSGEIYVYSTYSELEQSEILWSNGLVADLVEEEEDHKEYGNLVIAQMDYNGNNISTYNRDILGAERMVDLKTDNANNLYTCGKIHDTLFIFNNSILSSSFHADGVLLKFGNLPLGINDISNPPMYVYPNPTDDYIHFKSDNYKGKQYRITNTVGQTILNGNIKGDLTKIDVRNLQQGSYLINIENISKAVKFIIP
tara:strand:- start:157 stop:1734 length:1578 start_codon:yes stop_codon:yes gene_type:complete